MQKIEKSTDASEFKNSNVRKVITVMQSLYKVIMMMEILCKVIFDERTMKGWLINVSVFVWSCYRTGKGFQNCFRAVSLQEVSHSFCPQISFQ